MARILVVDPDPEVRKLVKTVLAFGGHIASGASAAEIANEEIRRNRYDVLLVDLSFRSPFDAWLTRLVANNDPIVARTIVTTGDVDLDHILTLAALPVFAVFAKPFDVFLLSRAVGECGTQLVPPARARVYARDVWSATEAFRYL